MDQLNQFKKFLTDIQKTVYLRKEYFRISDMILERSIRAFEKDYARWYPNTIISTENLYITPQLVAILCYRIAREIFLSTQHTDQLCITGGAADAFSILGRQIGLIEIYYSAEIGEGFKINHGIGTVIGARCKIGKNCTIHQGCTVGDRNGGRPHIGNNVVIYADSLILGDICIGDNSIIGANSVVTKSAPENSVLIGSPAHQR